MAWKIFNRKATQSNASSIVSSNQAAGEIVKTPLSYLHKLIPIGDLPDEVLQNIKVRLLKFVPGNIVYKQGMVADSIYYLTKGKIYLEAENGSGRQIDINTMAAFYPLSIGEIHQFTALAESEVQIICLPRELLDENKETNTENLELEIPEQLENNSLFRSFHDSFTQGNLDLPILPDVAIRLSAAVQKDVGIADAVSIVNLDPVIASKLIQTVNSPLYRTLTPAASCHDAVNRLGLNTTRTIVTSLCMKNLFQGKNKVIKKKFYEIWRQSIQMASISRTLAMINGEIDPDEAMLAGLVHNIGAIPLLKFADSKPEDANLLENIDTCLSYSQGVIGTYILKKWEFPENMVNIPIHYDDWFYDAGDQLTLSDIVILARFHSLIGIKKISELPLLTTLPAFQKLGKNTLAPDLSLQVLDDAKQQIADAMNLFVA
jgi:HD-like signal output (HDOD) protein